MNISHFYAMLSRMRYINRWGLMNNTRCENLSEHSLDVAVIAHCLVLIHNKRFGGNLNAERATLLALFHDATEIITGDMPTPIKYFNPEIKNAYKEIEANAGNRLVSMLPDDFKDDMDKIIKMNGAGDDELKKYVKAADKFSALIKCIEEIKTRQYGYDTLIGTNIAKLLTYLSRIWISKGIAVDEKILCASAPDNPFDNITEYIDRHYNEQLQVKELAKMCNMSYSNFARSFKLLYNQSCKEYIEFIRLNRVADLLIYTDLDLNYISQETGFSDCSHLIRSFKHWKGMTPKVWRREYGN